jgi:sugar phosphate isomerase/epimerase
MNRRKFITNTTLAAAATLAGCKAMAAANYLNIPLGFQTFPIRDRLGIDFPGTLKTMAGHGYKLTELCSPTGYKAIGFGFLSAMKTADIKSTITDAGLQCPSCHFTSGELVDHVDESIEFAHAMGLSQMICSTFWLPKTAALSDYQAAADKLNKAAEKIKAAGMQTGFHNHEFEFAQLEGQLIYDALMARFDPQLVQMQFQTEVINLGYKAADYFNKYPGRFLSAHLSDWTADKKEVPIGQGIIDWPTFFQAAKTGGVKNFFVEMKWETYPDSAKYVKSL